VESSIEKEVEVMGKNSDWKLIILVAFSFSLFLGVTLSGIRLSGGYEIIGPADCVVDDDCPLGWQCEVGECVKTGGDPIQGCVKEQCFYEILCNERGIDNCNQPCQRETDDQYCNEIKSGEDVIITDGQCSQGLCKAACATNEDCAGYSCPQGEPNNPAQVIARGCMDGLCDCTITTGYGNCMIVDKYGVSRSAPDGTPCGDWVVGTCRDGVCDYNTPPEQPKRSAYFIEFQISGDKIKHGGTELDCMENFPLLLGGEQEVQLDECFAEQIFAFVHCRCKYSEIA
jgi:hypothetical protein